MKALVNDDVTIDDPDWLYRRLATAHQVQVKKGVKRATSYAFMRTSKEPEHEPSLDLAKLTNPEQSVNRPRKAGLQLARFQAKCPRSLPGFDVVYSPQPENDAHCHISGEITHDVSRTLAGALKLMDVYANSQAEG